MVIMNIILFLFGISWEGNSMEIRTLRYFLAVAREENMSKAAELLHVTQPTLSKQLKSLEEELGKKLFARHAFSIQLTDEGILLRNRAEDLVSMADKIEQEFVSLDDIAGGELYLGLAESCQLRYLARSIKDFKQHYPNLHYHITSGDTEQLSEKVDKGLGYLLTYEHLVNTSKDSGLVFRPLSPKLENRIYIAWNRYQAFTPIAERFLTHLKESFQ